MFKACFSELDIDEMSEDELNDLDGSFDSVDSHSELDNSQNFRTPEIESTPNNYNRAQSPFTPLVNQTPIPHTPFLNTPITPLTTNNSQFSPINQISTHYYQQTTPITSSRDKIHDITNTPLPTPDFSTLDSGFLPRRLKRTGSNLQIPETPMKKVAIKSRIHNPYSSTKSTPLHTPENFSVQIPVLSDYEAAKYAENFDTFQPIGKGSFSEVFKARHIHTDTWYAIKVSKRPFTNIKQRERAIKELQTVKLLKHPHLLHYIFAWENTENKTMYIQMELCERGSLSNFLSKWIEEHLQNPSSYIKEDDLWCIITDMILGLHHMHSNNFIHLDIKPANIFIDQLGYIKIGDFGLTIRCDIDDEFTEGDSRYLAPEVLEPGIVKKESDIFSMGATILEMSSLIEMPASGDPWDLLRKGNIYDLGIIPTHYSDDLRYLIGSMMHPIYAHRPSTSVILSHPRIRSVLDERRRTRGDAYFNELHISSEFSQNNNNDHYHRSPFLPDNNNNNYSLQTPMSHRNSSRENINSGQSPYFTPQSFHLTSFQSTMNDTADNLNDDDSLCLDSDSSDSDEISDNFNSFHSFGRRSGNNTPNSSTPHAFNNNNSNNSIENDKIPRRSKNLLSYFDSVTDD